MNALLFQSSDDAFDHAVLLRAVRGDELLPKTVTAYEARVGSRGEDQPVIRPQQQRRRSPSERPEPRDQRLLERRHCSCRSTASRELPAKQFSRVTVDHKSQGLPAITVRPHTAQIRRPAFVRRCGDRRQCFDTRPMPNGSLANLPAFELENPLDRVLVELLQARHGSVTKRRLSLDHLLDRFGKALLDLRRRFNGLVVHGTARNLEPTTEFGHRNRESVFLQALLDVKDHVSSFFANRASHFFRARSSNIASPYASCSALSCDSYCSRMSSGLAFSAFSIPALAWSIQDSISEGGRSNCRDDSLTGKIY